MIARADTAGCSHAFLDACVERSVRFIVGHELRAEIAQLLIETPESAWQPAISADGSEDRDWAHVIEMTDMVDLSAWPEGTRMIARREHAHVGAQLTFTDIDGCCFQVCVTNLADNDICYLEALYRCRGRVERRICDAKDTGLANLPSASMAINQAWITVVMLAQDLIAWTQHLYLDADLAAAEPKRLRYSLLHVAGVIVRSRRRTSSASPMNGPGPTPSSPRSTGSNTTRCAAEQQPRPAAATQHRSRDNHETTHKPGVAADHDHQTVDPTTQDCLLKGLG